MELSFPIPYPERMEKITRLLELKITQLLEFQDPSPWNTYSFNIIHLRKQWLYFIETLQAKFDGNWANSHHRKWESMGIFGYWWVYSKLRRTFLVMNTHVFPLKNASLNQIDHIMKNHQMSSKIPLGLCHQMSWNVFQFKDCSTVRYRYISSCWGPTSSYQT